MSLNTKPAPVLNSFDGTVLRHIRAKELRLTSEQFAQLVGVHPNTVTRWENGRAAIPRTITIIVRLLTSEVTPLQLLKMAAS